MSNGLGGSALLIEGGVPLSGSLRCSGSKNSSLGMIAAVLLSDEPVLLRGVPQVRDVSTMLGILTTLGVAVRRAEHGVEFDACGADKSDPPQHLVSAMRASIMLLGPLLARFGQARLPLPGGCALGDRPVDMHERGLRAMGADIQTEHGVMVASLPQGRFCGADFRFPIPSVTGTEHLMMAACLARGTTRLENAALEPEVVSLAQMLRTMGADIEGEGTDCVVVRGVERLHGAMCPVPPDRIEAGTWLAAAAATRGHIEVLGEGLQIGAQVELALRGMGADLQLREGAVELDARDRNLGGLELQAAPHPGFPTDLQPQFMAVATLGSGVSYIEDSVFDQRFRHAAELRRLGANVRVRKSRAKIQGVERLSGADVVASDLRAAAGLVIAGLSAEGTTRVWGLGHLERGYEDPFGKLRGLGARVHASREEAAKL